MTYFLCHKISKKRLLIEKLLNANELVEKLNVPITWVYARTEKAATDPIPCIRKDKKGRLLRFDMKEVEKWMRKFHS